jgi:hypothetical protein
MSRNPAARNTGISVVGAVGALVLVFLLFAGPAFAVNGQVDYVKATYRLNGQLKNSYIYQNASWVDRQIDHDTGTPVTIIATRKTSIGQPDYVFRFWSTGESGERVPVIRRQGDPVYAQFSNCADGNCMLMVDNDYKYFAIATAAAPQATVSGFVKNAANQVGISSAAVRLYNNGV